MPPPTPYVGVFLAASVAFALVFLSRHNAAAGAPCPVVYVPVAAALPLLSSAAPLPPPTSVPLNVTESRPHTPPSVPPPTKLPVSTSVPLDVVSDPNLCMNNSQLFNGTIDDNPHRQISYNPPNCTLKLYTDALWRECLSRNNFLFYGDSQLEAVVFDLMRRLHVKKSQENLTSELTGKEVRAAMYQTTETKNASFFFMPRVTTVPWDRDIRIAYNVTQSRAALLTADVIVANSGMWDMGWGNCGPVRYYKALKRHLLDLQQRKRKSAKIFMFGLRWIHRHRCPRTVDMCYTCNHPDKVAVFREVNQLAASCMGIHIIDTHHMSRLLPDNTGDGVHYRGKVHNLELDLLGNAVCRSPALNPAHIPCDEEAYFKKWSLVEEAHHPCNHKPDTCTMDKVNPHLNPYEGQAFAEELARSGAAHP